MKISNIFSAVSPVPPDNDCQVTVEPSGDPEADRRGYAIADQICNNLTTDHPSSNSRWARH
jgi:hypothetical protein